MQFWFRISASARELARERKFQRRARLLLSLVDWPRPRPMVFLPNCTTCNIAKLLNVILVDRVQFLILCQRLGQRIGPRTQIPTPGAPSPVARGLRSTWARAIKFCPSTLNNIFHQKWPKTAKNDENDPKMVKIIKWPRTNGRTDERTKTLPAYNKGSPLVATSNTHTAKCAQMNYISWFLVEFWAVRINLERIFIFCALWVDGNDFIFAKRYFWEVRFGVCFGE